MVRTMSGWVLVLKKMRMSEKRLCGGAVSFSIQNFKEDQTMAEEKVTVEETRQDTEADF